MINGCYCVSKTARYMTRRMHWQIKIYFVFLIWFRTFSDRANLAKKLFKKLNENLINTHFQTHFFHPLAITRQYIRPWVMQWGERSTLQIRWHSCACWLQCTTQELNCFILVLIEMWIFIYGKEKWTTFNCVPNGVDRNLNTIIFF